MSKIDDVRDILIGLALYVGGTILTIYILQWIIAQLFT
jgi:hypothetical protein